MKALITTIPFAEKNELPLKLLEEAGVDYLINPTGKKYTEEELAGVIADFDYIVAGTEPITEHVMNQAKNLKLIARVGIGLDSIDLQAAAKKDIKVSFTPDAPAPAVSELTIGLMISLLRHTHVSNLHMHNSNWYRYLGRRISEVTVGLIGVGRIGKGVTQRLAALGCKRVLGNDLNKDDSDINSIKNFQWVDKDVIYREADVISIHAPLTNETRHMIAKDELNNMKHDAVLINTARGGIVNEDDLYCVMIDGHLSGAAIDVFEREPYKGRLNEIDRCLLTSHIGPMTADCRSQMEIEAVQEVVRFVKGEELLCPVSM